MRKDDLKTRAEAVDFVAELISKKCSLVGEFREIFFNWLARETASLALFGVATESRKELMEEIRKGWRPSGLSVKLCLSFWIGVFGGEFMLRTFGLAGNFARKIRRRNYAEISPRQKLLVVFDGTIGDTMVVVPAFNGLRRAFPDREIVVLNFAGNGARQILLPGKLADAVEGVPAEHLGTLRFFLKNYFFKKKNWQVVYLVRNFYHPSPISRFKVFLKRCAFFLLLRSKLLGAKGMSTPDAGTRHIIDIIADSLRMDGIDVSAPRDREFELNFTDAEREEAERAWADLGLSKSGGIVLAVCVGGKNPVQHWSEASWKILLERLAGVSPQMKFLFLGDKNDAALRARLCGGALSGRSVSLGAETGLSVRVSVLILAKCRGYVGHDTGTIHMAAAAGIPCVGIYSAHDYRNHWYPRCGNASVLRGEVPCEVCRLGICPKKSDGEGSVCLDKISPDEVFEAVEKKIISAEREKNGR